MASGTPNDPSDSLDEAGRIYAEFFRRGEEGEPVDLEGLCGSHPELAQELRELDRHWRMVSSFLGQLGASAPAGERLRRHLGVEIDRTAPLEHESEPQAEFSSEVIERLARRKGGFGRYSVKGEVAHGGQGVILRVWDEDLRRVLAMKVALGRAVPTGGGGAAQVDPRTLGRFLEEAQITGQLDHPGIIPIHELGLDADGHVYYTMKLLKGQSLKEIIGLVQREEQGWTVARAVGVISKVCETMGYAHHKGVIHRDLKPANVMVGRFGAVHVIDWGLARVLGREDTKDLRIRPEPDLATMEVHTDRHDHSTRSPDSPIVTMDGDVVGTPAYMSPEQARGEVAEVGPRSDVYSVGAMLYHVLGGRVPYTKPGVHVSGRDILVLVTHGPPQPLHVFAPDVPVELVAICEKAMARDAGARYADMEEFAEDLHAYLHGRVVRAYRTGAVAELRKWVRRNKALAATLLVALAIIIGGTTTSSVVMAGKNEDLTRAWNEARENQLLAENRTAEVLSLSALQDLGNLRDEARGLWPMVPAHIGAYEAWLQKAEALLADLQAHRRKREELRARALPATAADRELTRRAGAAAADLEVARVELRRLEDELDASVQVDPEAKELQRLVVAARDAVHALEQESARTRTWRFEDVRDQWWHDQLGKLIGELEALGDPEGGLIAGRSPAFGPGIELRLAAARHVGEASQTGREARDAWRAAIAAVARHPAYPGLAIDAQLGLFPLGPDPETGLWEFAHLQSGTVPRRDQEGRLQITAESGLVFVLLPGATFRMGAQAVNPGRPNYDPDAQGDESPVHDVTLDPFFVSKYEMTQGQWRRLTGANPSFIKAEDYLVVSPLNPVEQVSWENCVELLGWLGLGLPTEAQWEYAARGGTDTPWWTGADPLWLEGAVNLADLTLQRKTQGFTGEIQTWLDDGHEGHAPVDEYAANDFGLHNVHGNVEEWCRDRYGSYELGVCEADGERRVEDPRARSRIVRGGHFGHGPASVRASRRDDVALGSSFSGIGLRPCRKLER